MISRSRSRRWKCPRSRANSRAFIASTFAFSIVKPASSSARRARAEQPAHLLAREHRGQRRGALDADLRPARPVRPPEVLAKEQPQRADRLVDGAALVAMVLLEIMQERQHLLLPEQRRARHPALPGQAGDPAHILLLGAVPQGFELDETDERGYGIRGGSHRLRPSPRLHPSSYPMSPHAPLPRQPREAASFPPHFQL